MHYYQHHIGDFIKDTSFLTNEEIGIYLKLIWLYYDTESPLPNNMFELTMKTNSRESEDTVRGILGMFFTLSEDQKHWFHSRCEKEINNYKSLITSASKAGKASALKRASNRNNTDVQRPLDNRSTTVQPTNNHKPITNNHKPNNINTAPEGVTQETWESFLAQRKLSRAAVTETVIKAIKRESESINWTLEQALTEIVSRGWRSFKAEWVKDKPKEQNKSFYQTDLEIKQKRHDELVGKTRRQVIDITPDNFLELK